MSSILRGLCNCLSLRFLNKCKCTKDIVRLNKSLDPIPNAVMSTEYHLILLARKILAEQPVLMTVA